MGVAVQGVRVLAKSDAKECGRDWEYRRSPAGAAATAALILAAQACQEGQKNTNE